MTPVHWKKEEARVIKLSDYEKIEADRKHREERKKREETSMKEKLASETPTKDRTNHASDETNKEVDYNALDYEENDNQTDDEHEVPHKQVSSLVQYPLPGSFQPNQDKTNDKTTEESNAASNKRSEVLAMALGVQIKTGEDPPTGEIKISGYDKKNKKKNDELNFSSETNGHKNAYETNNRKQNLTGQSSVVVKVHQNQEHVFNESTRKTRENFDARNSERNKFENEKPLHHEVNDRFGKRDGYRRIDYRRNDTRRDDYRRPRGNRAYNYRADRYNRDRQRSRRSPRRSRERRRSRSRRRSSSRHSSSPIRDRSLKKDANKQDKSEKLSDNEKREEKKFETEAEKFKRRTEQIMLLKKKMELELLEMKKKKKDEENSEKQVCATLPC